MINWFTEGDKTLVFYSVQFNTRDHLSEEDYKNIKENPKSAQISQASIDRFLSECEKGKDLSVLQVDFSGRVQCPVNKNFADPFFEQLIAKYPNKRIICISNISSFGAGIPMDVQDQAIKDFGVDNSIAIKQEENKKFDPKCFDWAFREKTRKDYEEWNWIVIGDKTYQDSFDEFVKPYKTLSIVRYSEI